MVEADPVGLVSVQEDGVNSMSVLETDISCSWDVKEQGTNQANQYQGWRGNGGGDGRGWSCGRSARLVGLVSVQ